MTCYTACIPKSVRGPGVDANYTGSHSSNHQNIRCLSFASIRLLPVLYMISCNTRRQARLQPEHCLAPFNIAGLSKHRMTPHATLDAQTPIFLPSKPVYISQKLCCFTMSPNRRIYRPCHLLCSCHIP